ncbi:hypothetical protein HPP92_026414 [Vanilla planifolia]|uniref:Uncharacterized protein n=1 Tax=Vanilla planifolia TaxID=51239 RepID=A0A835PEC4_VANPL|nr:hypothetical protein HPP92_026414 [Vanilla planifolia]
MCGSLRPFRLIKRKKVQLPSIPSSYLHHGRQPPPRSPHCIINFQPAGVNVVGHSVAGLPHVPSAADDHRVPAASACGTDRLSSSVAAVTGYGVLPFAPAAAGLLPLFSSSDRVLPRAATAESDTAVVPLVL